MTCATTFRIKIGCARGLRLGGWIGSSSCTRQSGKVVFGSGHSSGIGFIVGVARMRRLEVSAIKVNVYHMFDN